MESIYKNILFYDIVKCVTEYLDNNLVKYEIKSNSDTTNGKTWIKITFKMNGYNIDVVHNKSDDVVYIVSNTNACSFDVFSKVQIIEIISYVVLKIKQGVCYE